MNVETTEKENLNKVKPWIPCSALWSEPHTLPNPLVTQVPAAATAQLLAHCLVPPRKLTYFGDSKKKQKSSEEQACVPFLSGDVVGVGGRDITLECFLSGKFTSIMKAGTVNKYVSAGPPQ